MKVLERKWNGILYNGQYGNFSVDTNLTNKGSATLDMRRRASIAYVLATNPETFEIFCQNNINLFHGTNINALPNILNYGMNSFDELSKKGIEVSTGEECTRRYNGRSFISFTDDLDTAIGYAGIKPSLEDSQKDKSFGMLIGISSDDVKQMKKFRVDSDVTEVGIRENVPLEKIKVILVPETKAQFVRKLVRDKQITVASINMDDKFYYIDDWEFVIDDKKAEEFVQGDKQENSITFGNEEVKEMASKREISGIKKIYRKIKEKFQSKGKDIEDDSREE